VISRRAAIARSAAAVLGAGSWPCLSQPPARAAAGRERKKGLGQSMKHASWAERLRELRCGWFYSWGPTVPPDLPPGIEFVPMIYRHGGDAGAIAHAVGAAKQSGIRELLGFNEPDAATQGNMSVAACLDAWPALMDTGMRLGSPSCVHPDRDWMIEFMAEVEKRGLRVDFVCVHSYGGPSAEALVSRLEKVHRMFRRPLWITEFAVGDWEAKGVDQHRHSPNTVLRFMERVLPMLDRLDYIERYAWFPAKVTSVPLGTSALFDAGGNLTRLGECYRDHA
jgi:hypothetical protein